MADPRKSDKALNDRMLKAIADYLEANGWSVMVIGDCRVQQQPDARSFNFEFVCRFTGAKRYAGDAQAVTDRSESR